MKRKTIASDPVVDEVRKAGEEMAREAGFDLHTLCERLREAEQRHPERVVRLRAREGGRADGSGE